YKQMNKKETYIIKKLFLCINHKEYIAKKETQMEKELSINFYIKNDLLSAKKLVTSNLQYVIKLAKKNNWHNLILSDLIQEGTIGLMKAVKKYDPKKGIKLLSFAIHWIKSEMYEYIIKNWKIVKIATTKSHRKLFFNLNNNKNNKSLISLKQAEHISKKLNINKKDIILMNQRITKNDLNLTTQNDYNHQKIIAIQQNPYFNIEKINFNNKIILLLKKFITNLNTRCKNIIKKRWFSKNKYTLKKLAINHNISVERVRQLEKEIIINLKNFVKLT
ncbi:MAG: sigma-70 family RNA polymerase sigma factor, partial [Enterobacteriaceae bacterium]|nr:sigma-70 family RNA polymerase sigma factor [Enterobacteriaceae bacterium]